MGKKYAQLRHTFEVERQVYDSIKVDVFTATFRTWGYIFMLRTGPAEFSKWLVTELKKNGYKPEGGEVLYGAHVESTPTEQTVFNMIGMSYLKPEDRFKDVI